MTLNRRSFLGQAGALTLVPIAPDAARGPTMMLEPVSFGLVYITAEEMGAWARAIIASHINAPVGLR